MLAFAKEARRKRETSWGQLLQGDGNGDGERGMHSGTPEEDLTQPTDERSVGMNGNSLPEPSLHVFCTKEYLRARSHLVSIIAITSS